MSLPFLGKWKATKSEKFDEYMKAVGVGMVLRKIGTAANSAEEWIQEGDYIIVKITSTFKNTDLKFKLGEEFDETTLDGRKVKSTFQLEGDKLVQHQRDKDGNVISCLTREIQGDELILKMECKGVVCERVHVRA